MKTNHNITGSLGFLIDEYYQLWADYYLKFFNAYAENNITFWGVTTQNEPATGYSGGINCLAWTSEQLVRNVNRLHNILHKNYLLLDSMAEGKLGSDR